MQKKLIEVPRTTLEIYHYTEDGASVYEFDATECSPPEPMVNTIVMLEQLKTSQERLKVLFFHEPTPLYERISQHFSYVSQEMESGDVLVTFQRKKVEL